MPSSVMDLVNFFVLDLNSGHFLFNSEASNRWQDFPALYRHEGRNIKPDEYKFHVSKLNILSLYKPSSPIMNSILLGHICQRNQIDHVPLIKKALLLIGMWVAKNRTLIKPSISDILANICLPVVDKKVYIGVSKNLPPTQHSTSPEITEHVEIEDGAIKEESGGKVYFDSVADSIEFGVDGSCNVKMDEAATDNVVVLGRSYENLHLWNPELLSYKVIHPPSPLDFNFSHRKLQVSSKICLEEFDCYFEFTQPRAVVGVELSPKTLSHSSKVIDDTVLNWKIDKIHPGTSYGLEFTAHCEGAIKSVTIAFQSTDSLYSGISFHDFNIVRNGRSCPAIPTMSSKVTERMTAERIKKMNFK